MSSRIVGDLPGGDQLRLAVDPLRGLRERGVRRLLRAALRDEAAVPGLVGRVLEDEPDEHLDVRARRRHVERDLRVRGLLRVRDAAAGTPASSARAYSVTQIGTRRWNHFSSALPNCVEPGHRHVRVRRPRARAEVRGRRVRVRRPGVERQLRVGLRRAGARTWPARPSRCWSVGLLRPRFEVSPTATSASGLPGLDPLVARPCRASRRSPG